MTDPGLSYNYVKPEGLLAHYTRSGVAFEHILLTGKLRMSPYREMRDPAENKDFLPAMAWHGERPNAELAWSQALSQLKSFRDAARILSFTHDAEASNKTFDCSWARPRMWEQYGDVHAGVCLVFDRQLLEQALRSQLGAFPGTYYVKDVRYSPAGISESPIRTLLDERIFDDELRFQAISDFVHGHHEDFFFLKSNDWATEYEYRVVVMQTGDDGYGFATYRDALRAVILGERFPLWQIAGAREVCDAAGVQLRQMVWDKGRPYAPRVPRLEA